MFREMQAAGETSRALDTMRVPSGKSFVRSAAMQDALRGLEAAVETNSGVLLCGETGSGRDLFARAIHLAGAPPFQGSVDNLLRRAMRSHADARPFVGIDCGNREAIEERLFGAIGRPDHAGLEQIGEASALHAARGGTLVLRQLPELPARVQARLARLLRDGEASIRLSDSELIEQMTFRLIATSEAQGTGDLLPELLKRVSQVVIAIPSLRMRRDDIPGLVRCLVADLSLAANIKPKSPSSQAIDLLTALPWRGNVGELESLLRRLVNKVPGRRIRLADVLAHVRLDGQTASTVYSGTLKEAREEFERDYVAAVLDQHRGRMAEAARVLGLQRTNLYRKVRQLSVKRRSSGRHLS